MRMAESSSDVNCFFVSRQAPGRRIIRQTVFRKEQRAAPFNTALSARWLCRLLEPSEKGRRHAQRPSAAKHLLPPLRSFVRAHPFSIRLCGLPGAHAAAFTGCASCLTHPKKRRHAHQHPSAAKYWGCSVFPVALFRPCISFFLFRFADSRAHKLRLSPAPASDFLQESKQQNRHDRNHACVVLYTLHASSFRCAHRITSPRATP